MRELYCRAVYPGEIEVEVRKGKQNTSKYTGPAQVRVEERLSVLNPPGYIVIGDS